jgi:glycerol-3-phosphate O-acyltransferase
VAYSFFLWLKERHPEMDLYRLLRLTPDETQTRLSDFLPFAEHILLKLRALYRDGKLLLPPTLRSSPVSEAITAGLRNVGIYHTLRPLKAVNGNNDGGYLMSDDMELLYYYHNRMVGYDVAP